MKYFLIAGERSGDLHGSNLAREILKRDPFAQIHGWGGGLMKDAGVHLLNHYRDISFMGFWEVLRNFRILQLKIKKCKHEIVAFAPDVLVLIDSPGFNLRMAAHARRHHIKTCCYISPKLWAWNSGRITQIKRDIDRMLVVLPFEKEYYEAQGYQVEYVGNPVLDAVKRHEWDFNLLSRFAASRSIAFLPGSRPQEVREAIQVIEKLARVFDDYQFLVSGVDNIDPVLYEPLSEIDNVSVWYGRTYELLKVSEAAVVTSGTATLEAAMIGVPQLVVYRTSRISYLLAKRLIKVPYISLVNLILNRPLLKELIQGEYNAINVAAELELLLSDRDTKKRISEGYSEILRILEGHSASERAADLICDLGRS